MGDRPEMWSNIQTVLFEVLIKDHPCKNQLNKKPLVI